MKKKLLFVIDSLHCAGAEKSLISLLSILDYSKYDVDLQLFGYGGELENLIPNQVNLLQPLSYTKFTEGSMLNSIKKCTNIKSLNMLLSRIRYSIQIRLSKCGNRKKARLFWNSTKKVIERNTKKYDIAIGYAQGIPTFYVIDKVNADKKIGWINTDYKLEGKDKNFQQYYYNKLDNIVTVSDSAKSIFLDIFPEYDRKIKVVYDINNYDFIKNMSTMGDSYDDEFDGLRILTIGRFDKSKRYDRALEACKILRDKNINFKWYSLGRGPLENNIKKYIEENELNDNFKLLGVKSNPYTYIKDADIYVQTSDFEGFGLAIAEARMLNTPVVTTEFDAVYNQMVQGKNGLVVDMNSESIAEGILKLINDVELRNSIVDYLKKEKKGNTEELEKFYKLIG